MSTAPARYNDDANVPPPERSTLAVEPSASTEVPPTTLESVLADLIAEIDALSPPAVVEPPAASGMALRAYADFQAANHALLFRWLAGRRG